MISTLFLILHHQEFLIQAQGSRIFNTRIPPVLFILNSTSTRILLLQSAIVESVRLIFSGLQVNANYIIFSESTPYLNFLSPQEFFQRKFLILYTILLIYFQILHPQEFILFQDAH